MIYSSAWASWTECLLETSRSLNRRSSLGRLSWRLVIRPSKLIGASLKLTIGFILLILLISFILRLLTSTSTERLQLLSLVKYHKLFEPMGFVSLVYIYDKWNLKVCKHIDRERNDKSEVVWAVMLKINLYSPWLKVECSVILWPQKLNISQNLLWHKK